MPEDEQQDDPVPDPVVWDSEKPASERAAYLRGTNLGNAILDGRPFGK